MPRVLPLLAAATAVVLAAPQARAVSVSVAPALANEAELLGSVYGGFDIELIYSGTAPDTVYDSFSGSETFWESQIGGYATSGLASSIPSLRIDVSFEDLDGPGGVLGSARATSGISDSGFITPDAGLMRFDNADLDRLISRGTLGGVILHEMAHVMGFASSVWGLNGAVGDADGDSRDGYVGPAGLAAYRSEYDPLASEVPLEDDGGPGTAWAHWDEQLFGGYGGSDNTELLTGWYDTPSTLSQTSRFSFMDVGYALFASDPVDTGLGGGGTGATTSGPSSDAVDPVSGVPVPGAGLLLLSGVFALALRRTRAA